MWNTKSPESGDLQSKHYQETQSDQALSDFDIADLNLIDEAHSTLFKSLRKVLDQSFTRNELFIKLTSRLDKIFTINRASLALYDYSKDLIEIPYMKANREYKSGVRINFVSVSSIIKNVLLRGQTVVYDFLELLDINELEHKILLDRNSKSLAIVPLLTDNKLLGTLNLASTSNFVFGLLKSEHLDLLFQQIAEKILELPR